MTALLIGALITHWRAGDHTKEMTAAAFTLLITVAYLITALAS